MKRARSASGSRPTGFIRRLPTVRLRMQAWTSTSDRYGTRRPCFATPHAARLARAEPRGRERRDLRGAARSCPAIRRAYMLGMNASPETVGGAAHRARPRCRAGRRATSAGSAGMLRGDFGGLLHLPDAGRRDGRSTALQVSLPLALLALALSTLIAFPVGIWAAARRGTAGRPRRHGGDPARRRGAELLVRDAAGPASSRCGCAGSRPAAFPAGAPASGPALEALTLPAIALALPQASILARVMRSALIDTLGEDFIRTARAKGLTRGQALWRHALRNALIPVLTIIGLQFSFLLAGAIIIENVFFLPGLGRLVFQAISQRDLDRGAERGDAAGLRGDPRHLPRRPRLCAGRPAAEAALMRGAAVSSAAGARRGSSWPARAHRSPSCLDALRRHRARHRRRSCSRRRRRTGSAPTISAATSSR